MHKTPFIFHANTMSNISYTFHVKQFHLLYIKTILFYIFQNPCPFYGKTMTKTCTETIVIFYALSCTTRLDEHNINLSHIISLTIHIYIFMPCIHTSHTSTSSVIFFTLHMYHFPYPFSYNIHIPIHII